MANEPGDNSPQPATRQSELLPAILAIALAVASQLAVQDGLTLLGLVGYIAAIWLFVASVRSIFEAAPLGTAPREPISLDQPAPLETEYEPTETIDSVSRLNYLRQNWRKVTLAEIFAGDIPPARLMALETRSVEVAAETSDETVAEAEGALEDAPVLATAQISTWSGSDSPASSPRAVKVTPQGNVLVLDTGLEQVQRFDEKGNLLATYLVKGLADVQTVDLDISPDGQTLYIVDAASGHLQVVSLADADLTGDGIGADEEE